MSRIGTTTRNTLSVAGMVLTATLAIPAITQAQSFAGEQMLLNHSVRPIGAYGRLAVPLVEASSGESSDRIDGRAAMGGGKPGTGIQAPAGPVPTAAGPTGLPGAIELSVNYGGVGSEGVDLLWRGATVGPLSGQVTVRVAYAGSPRDRGMPVWPVTALLFFSADDYRSSFIAELSGTIDWTEGSMLLAGLVTDGPATGTEVEQLLRLRGPDRNGSLTIRFPSRSGASIESVTAKVGNDAFGRPETWINGEQALLGRVSLVKSHDEGAE